MKSGVPWSVKGIEPQARESAKDAAHKAGLTLGQWLNQTILESERGQKKSPPAQTPPSGRTPSSKSKSSARAASRKTATRKPAARKAGGAASGVNARLDELSRKLDLLVAPSEDHLPQDRFPAEKPAGHFTPAEHNTDTAIAALRSDMSRHSGHIEPRPLAAPVAMPALEKTLSGLVDHIELTDRHNSEVLRTIQTRLSELSARLEEQGAGVDHAAIEAIEQRLGSIVARLETQDSGPGDEAFQALETQLADLNERILRSAENDRSGPAVAELKLRFNQLASKLSATERLIPPQSEFDELKTRFGVLQDEMSNLPAPVFPSALQMLESRLGTLAGEINAVRSTSVNKSSYGDLDARLNDLHNRLRTTEKSLSGTDSLSVETRIKKMQARLHRTEQSLGNTPDINTVETRFEEVQKRILSTEGKLADNAGTKALENRLADLSQRLDTSISGGGTDPQIIQLEARVNEITSRLDQGDSGLEPSLLKDLEAQINRIGHRLDQAEERFDTPLQTIQANLSQLYEGLETSHTSTLQAAEHAAVAAAQKLLASHSGDGTASGASEAIVALEQSLAELKAQAGRGDQQTQETLEAVHDTLQSVTGRLAALEDLSAHEDRGQTEPGQNSTVATGQSENESFEDFRLPPLPDIPAMTSGSLEAEAIDLEDSTGPELVQPPAGHGLEADDAHAEPEFARAYEDNESGLSRNGDFIAAARRAAQAANAAENSDPETGASPKNQTALLPVGKSKKRTLLYAVAALFVAVGALSVSGLLTSKNNAKLATPTSTGSVPANDVGEGSDLQATPKAFAYVPDLSGYSSLPGLDLSSDRQAMVIETIKPAALTPQFAPTVRAPATAGKFAPVRSGPSTKNFASEIMLAPSKSGSSGRAVAAKLESGTEKTVKAVLSAPDVAFPLPPEAIGSEALRRAAANGGASAQFAVGARFAGGQAGSVDHATAAVWYQRAAAQGHAPAQYRLGTLYEKGRGVKKDINTARTWYERAAETGNRKAMHNLAVLLANSSAGQPDFTRAARWFLRAANLGLADSQFNLAILHERGLGVETDPAKAYKWFRIAAAAGDKDAGARAAKLELAMAAGALARARAEVAAWRPKTLDPAANGSGPNPAKWATDTSAGPATASVAGNTQLIVARAQRLLTELGYDPGPADGLAGPKTKQAIRIFERERGLPVKGVANVGVVRALEAAAG